jgi:Glycosyl hydrolases family 2, sugar binding domain
VYPHRIRLRGPWECEPLARAGRAAPEPLPAPCRMALPCRWSTGGLRDFAGRVRFRRRFGYPGRLDATDHVWLTFAGAEGVAEVWLNGQWLGRHQGEGPFEFEVTPLLQARNELVVEVESATEHGGIWGEVAMEVRCPAFLRPVRLWAARTGESADLHVAGEVVGTCDRALDLYVLLDGATVLYTTLEPVPAGRPFHVVAEGLPWTLWQPRGEGTAGLHEVRIELVNGATVWYRIEHMFAFAEGSAE